MTMKRFSTTLNQVRARPLMGCSSCFADLPHCAFEFRPPSEFGYQAACAKLSSLSLAEPDHSIDMDNTEGVRCLGALISHVRRGGAGYELDDIADTTFAVENVALKRFMELDASAWAALNIFVEDVHPSVHSSRKKEGVSLFGTNCLPMIVDLTLNRHHGSYEDASRSPSAAHMVSAPRSRTGNHCGAA